MIRELLPKLEAGRGLSSEETAAAVRSMMHGEATDDEIVEFLRAIAKRGETGDEMLGGAMALRAEAIPFPRHWDQLLDTCGTGGDRSDTYNISTASAFVAAAAGVRVAKHGNRSVSSKSGSADVLEALGANIELGPQGAAAALEETGFTFLNARRFHPAMRHVARARAQLGIRTLFNWLGPLANPAGATHQLVGVPDRYRMNEVAETLSQLGVQRSLVVHGTGGIDELSLQPGNLALDTTRDTSPKVREMEAESIGLESADNETLRGGDPAVNAAIIRSVLSGEERGPKRDALILNSAAALCVAGKVPGLSHGAYEAREQIESGRALRILERFVNVSRKLGND